MAISDQKRKTPTADRNVISATVEPDHSSTVNDSSLRPKIRKGTALIKMPKRLAKLGVVSLATIGIHPKLRRSSIKINRNSLAWGTNRQVDAVKVAIQLGFQRDLLLSLRDALDDRSAARHAERKSEGPVSLHWDVLGLRRSDQASKKSEKHGENEQKNGWRKMGQKIERVADGEDTPGRLENARNKGRKGRNWNTKGWKLLWIIHRGTCTMITC